MSNRREPNADRRAAGEREPALVVDHIRKRYDDVVAVDDVSFTVQRGEVFGLLGPNAAGKTTALEIAEGLRQADSGQSTLFGSPVWPRNPALLGRLGVQLQTSSFFERLTAREQLRTFAALYGAPASRVTMTLEMVGLTDSAGTRVEKLSGGQVQRLAIACALVHDPDVVFLDEPSSGLDPQSRQNLWDVIRSIRSSGKTVVLTTHAMEEAEALCDRVAIMDHGRILASDAPALLVRQLDAPVQISLPTAQLPRDLAAQLSGVEAVDGDGTTTVVSTRCREVVLHELDERGLLSYTEVRGADLEDVFLTLTGREYQK